MASIGANVFKYLKLLKRISLANNKLSRASSFHKTFTNLFRSNELLLEIDLSNNELNDLPSGTFALTTLLERVCLSGNRFQEITFDIDHLVNLKLLDMRNNSVTSLNAASRNSLDRLYEKLRTKNDTGDFQIDLRENPFTCVCKSKSFLKWFVNSPIFSTTRDEYHCQAGETILPMNEEAIREAEEDCERPIRRRRILILSSVLPVCGLLILIIIMIRLVKYRKKTLMLQQFEDRVRLIQEGELGCTFPVFLSYSNDDANFVDIHILRPLKNALRAVCGTDRELICTGDKDFTPGHTIYSEMIRCLDDSAVFIAVMSRNYCNSEYCKLETEQARVQGKSIIQIFIEEVPENEMTPVIREVFRNFTCVKLVLEYGQYRLQPDWEHVCESVVQLI